jgi:excinuclease ABC, B subunit
VSLVAILDADKEGFLRSTRSLTQTVGRAARNVNGKAIMYADKITDSMQRTIDDTNYRREKQMNYNKAHGITPQPLQKKIENSLSKSPITEFHYDPSFKEHIAAETQSVYLSAKELEKKIKETRKLMEAAAKDLDFVKAAQYRDELKRLQELAN